MVKFHRNILAFFGFVLFCLWERNQEQMLSHMECAGCCVYFTTTVDIFQWEKKKKLKWKCCFFFSFPSLFERLEKDMSITHTVRSTIQTILLLCAWFQFKSFSTVALVLFADREKRDQWNVCWTTKSSFFFWAKYLPLGFDLKIVVKLTENVLLKNCHGNRFGIIDVVTTTTPFFNYLRL